MSARAPARRSWRGVALLIALAVGAVLLMRQTIAAQLGAWLAGIWVAAMDVIIRILAAFFGGG